MSKFKVADFYYGAVLSILFSQGIKPALIENGDDRRVYDFTTNNKKFTLYVKYRSEKIITKKVEYSSWSFNLNNDTNELERYIAKEKNLILALVCGSDNLSESELAVLDSDDINWILLNQKKSITLSRKKGEKYFRIANGGSRDGAYQIKCNRFEELF